MRRSGWVGLLVSGLGLLLGATGCGKGVTSPPPPGDGPLAAHQVWQDASPMPGSGWGEVLALAPLGSSLLAGGDFIPGGALGGVSLYQGNGRNWSVFRPDFNSQVEALGYFGGALIAAGGFTGADKATEPLDHIARWDGAAWRPLGGGTDHTVTAIAEFHGQLIAAGTFLHAGGAAAGYIAAFDGTSWHTLGAGLDAPVWALAIYRDHLIAAGDFGLAGGAPARRIAAWDGSAWTPLGTGFFSTVLTLLSANDTLYAGGYFTRAGGISAGHIARWDGVAWSPIGFGLGAMQGDYVAAIATTDSGLVAGGSFEKSGATDTRFVARWKNGNWQPMGTGLGGPVRALIVHDGQLYAGGALLDPSGASRGSLYRWAE